MARLKVAVRLRPEIVNKLNEEAKKKKTNFSRTVERAIEETLDNL